MTQKSSKSTDIGKTDIRAMLLSKRLTRLDPIEDGKRPTNGGDYIREHGYT
jgi:hypothetical protein